MRSNVKLHTIRYKKEKRLHKNVSLFSRGDRIRTCDHLVPNQARYRTALHPVGVVYIQVPQLRNPLLQSKRSRGDRIRTCDHLVPNQARYRTALHPVSCKVSDFASAKVLIKSEPCKFFYNYLFKKQIISQTLLRETLWLSKRPFNKQLFKP